MKKILIALDYDPFSEQIATIGYNIAKQLKAELLLVHVVSEPSYYTSVAYSPIMGFTGFNDPAMFTVSDNLEKEAWRFLEESRKHLGDKDIDIEVVSGDFTEALLEAASTFGANLIVAGTHRRSGLDRFMMGDRAEKLLHHTNIPVLFIPDTTKE